MPKEKSTPKSTQNRSGGKVDGGWKVVLIVKTGFVHFIVSPTESDLSTYNHGEEDFNDNAL